MHCFAVTNPPSACMCAQNATVLVWHFNFGFEEERCGVGNISLNKCFGQRLPNQVIPRVREPEGSIGTNFGSKAHSNF